jgi:UDP:flavonoid glycosyltransferase YjiC (YdhE family)
MTTLAACDYTVQGLGTSTLIETLVAGKPMVAISLDRPYEEQVSKGRGVQAFELGIHIPLQDFNTERLKNSLLSVINEEPNKNQTTNFRKVLGDLKGSQRMCNLLMKYLT